MYQPPYSGHQPVRGPAHPHPATQPPPLHIQTSTPSQPQYQQYQFNYPPPSASAMSTPRQTQAPPSPSEQSDRNGTVEEDFYNMPGPDPSSHIWNNYVWALEVVQHPQRARMCGFGDKDRRPISPPPCIRLIIMDPQTKQEINYEEIELSHLVLAVDIWDMAATRELNLVKQSNTSPCISSAATSSFPVTTAQPPQGHEPAQSYPITSIPNYQPYTPTTTIGYTPTQTSSGNNGYYSQSASPYQGQRPPPLTNGHNGQPPPYQNGSAPNRPSNYHYHDLRTLASGPPNPFSPQQQQPHQLHQLHSQQQHQPQQPQGQQPHQPQQSQGQQQHQQTPSTPGSQPASAPGATHPFSETVYLSNLPAQHTLYTRNLIGSLSASAFKLSDENDKLGIWFVLQDLSVRTEGWFRLKLNFFNLSQSVEKQLSGTENSPSATAPCLASAFSNPFKVFSAKKFPGVVESTPLSRAFATQGIKIPIRKDTQGGSGGKRGREGSDDEDGSE